MQVHEIRLSKSMCVQSERYGCIRVNVPGQTCNATIHTSLRSECALHLILNVYRVWTTSNTKCSCDRFCAEMTFETIGLHRQGKLSCWTR